MELREKPIEQIPKYKNKHLIEGNRKVGRLQQSPEFLRSGVTPEKTFRCLPNLEGAFRTPCSSMQQEGLTRDEGWPCLLERTDVKSTVLSAGGGCTSNAVET